MDEILHQLVGLLVGAVPTILLFLLLLAFYGVLVYRPLVRVLAERRARTAGAIEQANLAITAADQKAREYETWIREARMTIFQAREQRVRQWNLDRENALKEARTAAQLKAAEAKNSLAQETEAAHRTLERSAEDLAREILRKILPSDSAPSLEPAGSSR